MIFLRYPATAVNTLLAAWAKHMQSEEYANERARSARVDEADAEAVAEKERQEAIFATAERQRLEQ